jgi:uroporphyrinogen-III synthase
MGSAALNIVLTRERGANDTLLRWLPEGAQVREVPLTTTRYYDEDDVRDALSQSTTNGLFRSLVVTSERSAAYVASALAASTGDVHVFSVGPSTTIALSARGVAVHEQGDGSAMALARGIAHGPVLLLGAQVMREELAVALRANGLDVTIIACYETVALQPSHEEAATLRAADVIFVGAPSAWTVARAFVAPDAWIVVPGATTGAVVRAQHPRVIEGWGLSLRERLNNL